MVKCGDHPTAGPLVARFPAVVTHGEPMVTGMVEVIGPLDAVVTPVVDAFLASGGRIVTLLPVHDLIGRPVTLGPGDVVELPASAMLLSCQSHELLPAGTYEIYVRVVLNHDGSSTEIFGGPWPLELRVLP